MENLFLNLVLLRPLVCAENGEATSMEMAVKMAVKMARKKVFVVFAALALVLQALVAQGKMPSPHVSFIYHTPDWIELK